MAHDVSHELRGEHGKWASGGATIHRLASEAGKAAAEGKHQKGDRVKYKTGALGTVHHIDEKGTPHIVWDRGRGKPVRTPAHHLTKVGGEKQKATEEAAKNWRQEKLAEIGHVPAYKPPRQAGSRGGVPAPTTGPDLAHERFISEKLADGQWHDPATVSKDRQRAISTLSRMESSGKVESRISPTSQTKQWRLKGRPDSEKDTGYSPGKGVTSKARGAGPEAKYRNMSDAELRNYEISRGSEAARQERLRREGTGGLTPELREQVRRIQAEQKAKMEEENKGRGGVTEYKDIYAHPESAEYLAKLRGGGMQATRPFEQVHSEYQAAQAKLQNPRITGPAAVAANRRDLQRLESELRGMGARRTGGNTWEMPPKPGTPEHSAEKLRNELASINEQLHDQHREAGAPLYSPEDLVGARFRDVSQQVKSGQKTIVVKVPSGSEIQMSPETAQHLMNKNVQAGLGSRAPQSTAQRRAGQQSRLADAAARRGITSRRKMA